MKRKWKPSSEELEQETLIIMWDDNINKEEAREIALQKLYSEHIYFNNIELKDLSSFIDQSFDNTSYGYMPYILGHVGQDNSLNYFERYICYLLKHNKKKEVRQMIGCTSSYLSKVIKTIKKKISQSSSEENSI